MNENILHELALFIKRNIEYWNKRYLNAQGKDEAVFCESSKDAYENVLKKINELKTENK